MKMQKVIVGFIGIVASVIIGVSTASSAVMCKSATVNEIQVIPALENATVSMYAIKMTCEDTTGLLVGLGTNQYLLVKDMGTPGYALALTAIAAGKKVTFYAGGTTWNSIVTRMHLTN